MELVLQQEVASGAPLCGFNAIFVSLQLSRAALACVGSGTGVGIPFFLLPCH